MSPNPDLRPEGTLPYVLGQMASRLDSIDKHLERINARQEQAETDSGSRHEAIGRKVRALEDDQTKRKGWILGASAMVGGLVSVGMWLVERLWK